MIGEMVFVEKGKNAGHTVCMAECFGKTGRKRAAEDRDTVNRCLLY